MCICHYVVFINETLVSRRILKKYSLTFRISLVPNWFVVVVNGILKHLNSNYKNIHFKLIENENIVCILNDNSTKIRF